jgi:hypothetical protein
VDAPPECCDAEFRIHRKTLIGCSVDLTTNFFIEIRQHYPEIRSWGTGAGSLIAKGPLLRMTSRPRNSIGGTARPRNAVPLGPALAKLVGVGLAALPSYSGWRVSGVSVALGAPEGRSDRAATAQMAPRAVALPLRPRHGVAAAGPPSHAPCGGVPSRDGINRVVV